MEQVVTYTDETINTIKSLLNRRLADDLLKKISSAQKMENSKNAEGQNRHMQDGVSKK